MKIRELEKRVRELEKQNEYLAKIAYVDKKLEIYNRNWLEMHKKDYINKSVYIAIIDVNGLKKINDTKGHNAGDEYLNKVVNKMSKISSDIVRLGGDEFLLIIEDTKIAINTLTSNMRIMLKDFASFGITKKTINDSFYLAMKKADKLMYINKNNYYQTKKIGA